MFRVFIFVLALTGSLISWPGFAAGGSYLVDDASITPASHCQLESWMQFRTGARTPTSVPACSGGEVEYSAQLSGGVHAGAGSVAPSAKWLGFHGSRAFPAAGVRGNAAPGVGRRATTFQLDLAGRWLVNTNVGASHAHGQSTRRLLGAGVEFAASASATLLAEFIDTAGATRTMQAGVRLPFGNNSIDLVVGRSLGQQADRWVNMGLNLAF